MFDPKVYAQKILTLTKNHTGAHNYPVPVSRLRGLCNAILENDQEADQLPPLTDVETSCLAAIKADVAQGIQPTVRSVAERLEYKTPSSAGVIIQRLLKHGYIKREGSRKQIVVVSQRK